MRQTLIKWACVAVVVLVALVLYRWWVDAKLGDRIAMACLLATVAMEAAIWGGAIWFYGHDPFQIDLRRRQTEQAAETRTINARKERLRGRPVQVVAR